MAVDRYGRALTNLRISVTRRCNLNCIYCHREGDGGEAPVEMTPEEIKRIVEVAVPFGVTKVKITGGEPLLREDICEVTARIKEVPQISEVSMTTNGILLPRYIEALKNAGLDRVNVGLPSLHPAVYKKLTGTGHLGDVEKGLELAEKIGLTPVKINLVVLKDINEGEIWNMIRFIAGRNLILQLIELEKLGAAGDFYEKHYFNLHDVEQQLKPLAAKVETRRLQNRRVYCLNGSGAKVELVRPFHRSDFCMNCTRMRVTAAGELKPCLMREDNHVNLLNPIRMGVSMEKLRDIFQKALMLREPYFCEDYEPSSEAPCPIQ